MTHPRRRIPHSLWRRALYSFVLVGLVLAVGTEGMHLLEGMSYLDAFYFTSMIATAQGPTYTPATVGGKIFAAALAFVSVGSVVTALLFILGPFFGAVLKSGAEKVEKEAEKEFGRSLIPESRRAAPGKSQGRNDDDQSKHEDR